MASITPMPAPRTTRLNDIVQENVLAQLAVRRLTGRKAAPLMGLTQATLSDKLRGRTRITADDIEMFAEFLGVDVAELVTRRWAPWGSNPQPADNQSLQVSEHLAPVFELETARRRPRLHLVKPLRVVVSA